MTSSLKAIFLINNDSKKVSDGKTACEAPKISSPDVFLFSFEVRSNVFYRPNRKFFFLQKDIFPIGLQHIPTTASRNRTRKKNDDICCSTTESFVVLSVFRPQSYSFQKRKKFDRVNFHLGSSYFLSAKGNLLSVRLSLFSETRIFLNTQCFCKL